MLAESVLIIASILFAFGIDAWWNERQDRLEEREVLLTLQNEFMRFVETINDRFEIHRDQVAALEQLALSSQVGEWSGTAEAFDVSISHMMSPTTLDLGSGVVEALVGVGRIEIIVNRELRRKLAAWGGVLDEVLDDEVDNSAMVFDQINPYLAGKGVPVSASFRTWGEQAWRIPSRSAGANVELVNELLADPEFQTLVEQRLGYKYHLDEELDAAIEAANAILREIEASLRSF